MKPFLLAMLATGGLLFAHLPQAVDPVDLVASEVSHTAGEVLYRYTASVPSTSTGGVPLFILDLSAPPGSGGDLLGSEGVFVDLRSPLDPVVPVGVGSPDRWGAVLNSAGELSWFGISPEQIDSIAPGDSRSGFTLRSPFLPGVRTVFSEPTTQACCREAPVDSVADEWIWPSSSDFRATSYSIGPRYPRARMDLETLRGELALACDALLWVTDSSLCGAFRDSLDIAEARLELHDYEAAAVAVRAVADLAEVHRAETGGSVEANAYWLLKTNSDFLADTLLARMPPGPRR